jgi:hypothetical protein
MGLNAHIRAPLRQHTMRKVTEFSHFQALGSIPCFLFRKEKAK